MFVTLYVEYPIWEPAEGGYYYAGESVGGNPKKVKAGKGKREIAKLYRQIQEDIKDGCYRKTARAWISDDGRECGVYTEYIGEGFRYVLESKNHVGRQCHGWQPYC